MTPIICLTKKTYKSTANTIKTKTRYSASHRQTSTHFPHRAHSVNTSLSFMINFFFPFFRRPAVLPPFPSRLPARVSLLSLDRLYGIPVFHVQINFTIRSWTKNLDFKSIPNSVSFCVTQWRACRMITRQLMNRFTTDAL